MQQSQIRISACELPISEDNPYRFDRLNRKPSCDLLTRFVTCVEGPCTIAIDAAWGRGKTTFLRLWAAHLKNNAFSVIKVNAWKTDYFNDPFLAIVGEMTKQLEASDQFNDPKQIGLSELKEGFAKVASIAPRVAASYVGLNGEDFADLVSAFEPNARRRLGRYEEQLTSVVEFHSKLKSVAQKIRDKTEKPLIVLIDELDRCRPIYAVEFLEVVKHLMGVDHVVYVFAMNRSELAHAVSGCYGPEFNGKGYLRRFFDIDFTLPLPSRRSFIDSFFEEQLAPLISTGGYQAILRRLLQAFLGVETISLRQIQQALYRFRLVLVFARPDIAESPNGIVYDEFCIALILHLYDPDMLRKFLCGELSDKDVVESSLPSTMKGDGNLLEERLWFETIVIRAAQEIAGLNQSTRKYGHTPLLQSYKELVGSTPENLDVTSERHFADVLMRKFQDPTDTNFCGPLGRPNRFRFAVKQLEMLEPLTNSRV